jgi:hypothetical protein
MNDSSKNSYMEEVLQQQQVVAQELKKRAAPAAAMQRMRAPGPFPAGQQAAFLPVVEEGRAVDVRITGWWRFKTVIVPPNAWVVHTRRGVVEPLHLGLGVSFPFNPFTDAFLVAPATMQTLAINAKCICKERQGILVQAYVQWIIDDFKGAYKRIDFSDADDPMRIVNVQLREQAEASIKDKVASMSIDEVLTDKRPLIDELTARLRSVAEGQGLKIVTVQIKEAVVSSTRLWENLQKPFREEQSKIARLAELDRERAVHEREMADAQANEALEQKAARVRATEEAETERVKKTELVSLASATAKLEAQRVQAQLDEIEAQKKLDDAVAARALLTMKREIERATMKHESEKSRERVDIEVLASRRKVDNDVSAARIDEALVRSLPELVSKMPAPQKSEHVHIGGDNAPDGVVAIAGLVKALRAVVSPSSGASG